MDDPAETKLLRAILAGDDPSRAVYADWLEQHGRPEHAELVRLHEAARDPAAIDARCRERLQVLSAAAEPAWRMQVARPAVEACDVGGCPRDWGSMAATDASDVRRCARCAKPVHYCSNGNAALGLLRTGARVVFDAIADRSWTCSSCVYVNPFEYRYCQSCGTDRLVSRPPSNLVGPVVTRNPPAPRPRPPELAMPRPPVWTCPRCGAPSTTGPSCAACVGR